MKNNRFVFDTNTLISAVILPRSTPAFALQKAEKEGFLFASLTTFNELEEVIHRKKFDKYVPLETRLTFLHRYRSLTLFLPITQHVADCRDPKDNQFLDIALAAQRITSLRATPTCWYYIPTAAIPKSLRLPSFWP